MTLSSLISLISLSTADLLCYQVLTCEAVIPKGRFQSITAGILLRIYTLASCSNCGMTKFYISLLFALLSFLLPYCGFAAKIGKKSILKCVLVTQSPKKFFSGRATSLKSCFFCRFSRCVLVVLFKKTCYFATKYGILSHKRAVL